MDIEKKLEYVANLVAYAEILRSKGDIIQSSLLACKALEILTLSAEEENWLKENDGRYKALYEKKEQINKHPYATEKLIFMIKNYYFTGQDDYIYKDIERNIINEQWVNEGKGKDAVCKKSISKLRNDIIHDHFDSNSKDYISDTDSLISKLKNFPFIRNRITGRFGDRKIICDWEVERDLRTEFGMHGNSDMAMTKPSFRIKKNSFENLIEAKKNIFLLLRDILQDEIQSPYVDNEKIQLSNVDSTSAYVWLTIPLKTKKEPPEKYKKRIKLYVPTVSVIMTPLELFVYLEFGGFTYKYKTAYYKYIMNNKHLVRLTTNISYGCSNMRISGIPCYRNVHWYVFQNRIFQLDPDMAKEDLDQFINNFEKELKKLLREKQEQFRITVESNKAISWNIALPGWIYPYNLFQEKKITVSYFAEMVQEHINSLEPVMEYMCRLKNPFKKIEEKEYRIKICDTYDHLCQ